MAGALAPVGQAVGPHADIDHRNAGLGQHRQRRLDRLGAEKAHHGRRVHRDEGLGGLPPSLGRAFGVGLDDLDAGALASRAGGGPRTGDELGAENRLAVAQRRGDAEKDRRPRGRCVGRLGDRRGSGPEAGNSQDGEEGGMAERAGTELQHGHGGKPTTAGGRAESAFAGRQARTRKGECVAGGNAARPRAKPIRAPYVYPQSSGIRSRNVWTMVC